MSGRHTGSSDAIDIAALGDEEIERPASRKRIICYIAKSLQSARSITVAGETVILWWGIFDNELYVEHSDKRFGPYAPVGRPIPLYRYRAFKKTPTQQRADRIEALAEQLALPRVALENSPEAALLLGNSEVPVIRFTDPDPFQEFTYPNALAAKRAIADYLGIALAKLPPEQLDWINALVSGTLNKRQVLGQVQEYFNREHRKGAPC